jgi:hypothetical protein
MHRSKLLRANSQFIPSDGFRMRKQWLLQKGLVIEEKKEEKKQQGDDELPEINVDQMAGMSGMMSQSMAGKWVLLSVFERNNQR